jgi:predicted RND superfamily exporter protein
VQRIVNKILNTFFQIHPLKVFVPLLALTAISASFLPQLKFNYNIESFFSSEDEEVSLYETHKGIFENENNFLLIGLKNDEGTFHQPFLSEVDSLSNLLKEVKLIERVVSPTQLNETIKTPLAPLHIPILHLDNVENYERDKRRIYASNLYYPSFFSKDTTAVSIFLTVKTNLSKAANDSLVSIVNDLVNSFHFDETHLAGRIHTQHYYINEMQKQIGLFASLAALLLIISLYLIFRNFYYVFIATISLAVALILIFGIMAWWGIEIDLMLTMLPALIFIISISGIVHIISRFKLELLSSNDQKQVIKKAFKYTITPNFLNAITTALGFSSLVFIPISPIQQFGVMVALGIIIAFLVNIFIIPFALMLLPLPPRRQTKEKTLKTSFIIGIVDKPKLVLVGLLLIIAGSIFYINEIKTNNFFLEDLNPTSSLKKDLDFFDDNFSGIRPFELNIRARNGRDLLSLPLLLQLDTLESYLKSEYKIGSILSPLAIVKSLNKSNHNGQQEYFKLPATQAELNRLISFASRRKLWNKFSPLLDSTHTTMRLSGRSQDLGSIVLREKNKDLNQFLNTQTGLLDVSLTGAAHLMDNANHQISKYLVRGILMAVIIATLIIGLFTHSVKLAILSLIPNLFPLILIAGFMGLVGIHLKVSTALIFTIVYGIAVDDTIHFLNSYRLNKFSTKNRKDALAATIFEMWKPMTQTSLVLASGFLIFSFSAFPSISMLGYLVSGSMIIALLADLVILPVFLNIPTFHYQKVRIALTQRLKEIV